MHENMDQETLVAELKLLVESLEKPMGNRERSLARHHIIDICNKLDALDGI